MGAHHDWQLRGRPLVLVGAVLGLLLVFLEATEDTRTRFLPSGSTDHAVDIALAVAVCLTAGWGSVRVLVAHVGPAGLTTRAAPAARLRARAVARLDAASPARRLEGLRDLELLGQASPGDRQTVVDHWCAYLHRFSAPAPSDPAEVEVREAAQQLIARHLREVDDRAVFATHWPEVREVNLEGARLSGLDFRGCLLPFVNLAGASFDGDAHFDDARFTDEAAFDAADFRQGVSFARATFARDAAFYGALFHADATFDRSFFTCSASFDAARFAGAASFRRTVFSREAQFDGAQFREPPRMTDARARVGFRHRFPAGWTLDDGDDAAGWASVVAAP